MQGLVGLFLHKVVRKLFLSTLRSCANPLIGKFQTFIEGLLRNFTRLQPLINEILVKAVLEGSGLQDFTGIGALLGYERFYFAIPLVFQSNVIPFLSF